MKKKKEAFVWSGSSYKKGKCFNVLDQIYENLGLRYVVYWVVFWSVRFIKSNELGAISNCLSCNCSGTMYNYYIYHSSPKSQNYYFCNQ